MGPEARVPPGSLSTCRSQVWFCLRLFPRCSWLLSAPEDQRGPKRTRPKQSRRLKVPKSFPDGLRGTVLQSGFIRCFWVGSEPDRVMLSELQPLCNTFFLLVQISMIPIHPCSHRIEPMIPFGLCLWIQLWLTLTPEHQPVNVQRQRANMLTPAEQLHLLKT